MGLEEIVLCDRKPRRRQEQLTLSGCAVDLTSLYIVANTNISTGQSENLPMRQQAPAPMSERLFPLFG